MNLHIDPVNGFIVVAGLLVGYLVYRRPAGSTGAQTPSPPQKDLLGGAGAALTTILVLAFLFGLGDGANNQVEERFPSPVPTATSAPLGGSQNPPAGR